jgi:hypothetical protein
VRMRDGELVSDVRQAALNGPPPRFGARVDHMAEAVSA